jgi:hypothetical protein
MGWTGSEILQEFTEKSVLKQAVQKKLWTSVQNKHGQFVTSSFFTLAKLSF